MTNLNAYILAFGGGVDSTTLIAIDQNRDKAAQLLGIDRRFLNIVFPRPDYIVMADTGAECQATYQHLERMQQLLGDRLTVIAKEGENIEEWCNRLGIVPVMPGGSHVCSLKYKGEVMAKWAAGLDVYRPTWMIGIEADEARRAKRFSKPEGDQAQYIYPLMDLGLTRERCEWLLDALGWDPVAKSSCVFCPFKSEEELRDMYFNDPDAWQRCETLEARFRQASQEKHQAWIAAGKPLNKGGRGVLAFDLADIEGTEAKPQDHRRDDRPFLPAYEAKRRAEIEGWLVVGFRA